MSTKEQILQAAFRLFLQNGYKNTSMSELVKATNFSKGALYHHFANKEALYQEVINQYFLSYFRQVDLDNINAQNAAEVETLIKEYYAAFIPEIQKICNRNLGRYFILFFEANEYYPEFKVEVRQFYDQLTGSISSILQKDNIPHPNDEAIKIIAKYEGLIFLLAIFPERNLWH